MLNINRSMFTGRLTRDAEAREVGSGYIVSLAVAINNPYQDKDGNWHNETAFVDVKVFGKAADRARDLAKGEQVYIEGSIRQESWEKDGQKRSKLLFKADSVKPIRDSSGGDHEGLKTPANASRPSDGLHFDQPADDDVPF